jgi:hypothetical protein
MLCNANMDAAKPLNKAEVDYVMAKCRNCSGCSKNCQSCGFTFPF